MTVHMLRDLEKGLDDSEPNKHQADCLLMGITPKLYQPLMKRTTCGKLIIEYYRELHKRHK